MNRLLVAVAHFHQIVGACPSSFRAGRGKFRNRRRGAALLRLASPVSRAIRECPSVARSEFLVRPPDSSAARPPRLSDQNLVQLHVVIDVFLALLALDLIKRRLRDVDFAGAHQLGHLPEEKRQQQSANVRAVHVGVRHDDDAAVTQLVMSKSPSSLPLLSSFDLPMPVPIAVIIDWISVFLRN
jgi:hypothetical protein